MDVYIKSETSELRNYNKEKLIIILFFAIFIVSQGIRGYLNDFTSSSIFNYHIVPVAIIFFMFLQRKNKFSKVNFLIFISILALCFLGFLKNRYGLSDLFRTIIGFLAPMMILLIDYRDIDIKYIFPKMYKYFNIFIYFTFMIQVIMSIKLGRTGGIVGHPLTSGWYYSIFISFNMIYYKFFKEKGDFSILLDIVIALTGTVLAAGRISLFAVIFLGVIYTFSCCRRRSIPYLILPIMLGIFLSTDMVNKFIWDKFKETAAWGDITNGRMLGIRDMLFFDLFPKFLLGRGLGYSNYVSQYLFGVVNFENPIIMFAFDHGILTTILVIFLLLIIPLCIFINRRNYLLAINFICLFIIPFSYNGLAETVGILIVLTFLIYIFLALNFSEA
ncbi:hypothetical protein E5347_09410 [Clostridium sartagoforme]|uniref:O-antigen ligase domain-containing protein n=1 Tax=Clostridium sartagoforme TaxID=84031 RepID=A0A4S2DJN6_9CLOT|nr:hypothetical protein [Clostridium sartagoforme]TGY42427.1 hypothetical protein E5347_09410 [Clostridium sartagoforme]